MPFTWEQEDRFSWGEVRIRLNINEGRIQGAKMYSDSMDCRWVPEAEKALTGSRFAPDALEKALQQIPVGQDLLKMLWEDAL